MTRNLGKHSVKRKAYAASLLLTVRVSAVMTTRVVASKKEKGEKREKRKNTPALK